MISSFKTTANKKEKISNSFLINIFSRMFKTLSNFIIIPFVYNFFEPSDLKIWFVFLSFSTIIVVLDLGFLQLLSRYLTFSFSNVPIERLDNLIFLKKLGISNYGLVILKFSQMLYKLLSSLVFFLLISVGSYYIFLIIQFEFNFINILSWIILTLSLMETMYQSRWHYFLNAIGGSGNSSLYLLLSKIIYLILIFTLLIYSKNIIIFPISLLISGFIERYLCRIKFLRNYPEINFNLLKIDYKLFLILLIKLLPETKRATLLSISALINSTIPLLLLAVIITPTEYNDLFFTIQILGFINSISLIYFQTNLPIISKYKFNNNFSHIKIFIKSLLYFIIIQISFYSFLFFIGNLILNFFGFSLNVIANNSLLLLLFVINSMDSLTSIFTSYLTLKNKILHHKSFIITSIIFFVLVISFQHLDSFTSFNLYLIYFVLNLGFNYWYWILKGFKFINN